MRKGISFTNIFKVSIPIMISGLSVHIVNITDTIFLGNLNEQALGAAGNAGILYYIFVLLGMGFSTGSQIIIGRRNGEKRFHLIGSLVTQTGISMLLMCSLFFVLLRFGLDPILALIVESEEILVLIREYLHHRSWGIFFTLGNMVFVSFFIGTTKTRVLGILTPIIACINIFLDFVLIYGEFGFPAMGVKGAALASNISEALGFCAFFIYTWNLKTRNKYRLFESEGLNPGKIKRILVTAGPIMVQNFITITSWFVFFSIIENLGQRELAISHIVRSIYMVAMIPVFGLGDGTNTLVSNLMGQKNQHMISTLLKRVVIICVVSNLLTLPLFLLFPGVILGIYTDNPQLIIEAKGSLYVICGAMFVFSVALVLYRAITGIGRTKHAMFIEIISIAIYMFYTWYVGVVLKTSIEVVWMSEFVYFGVMLIICYLYLRFANWKTTQV